MKSKVEQLASIQKKMMKLQTIFFYFINNQWIYQQKLQDVFWAKMTAADKAEFKCDSRAIDWKKSLVGFSFGIRRFFMREDCLSPEEGYKQLFKKNNLVFAEDLRYAGRLNPNLTRKDISKYFPAVLSQSRFEAYVQTHIINPGSKKRKNNSEKPYNRA